MGGKPTRHKETSEAPAERQLISARRYMDSMRDEELIETPGDSFQNHLHRTPAWDPENIFLRKNDRETKTKKSHRTRGYTAIDRVRDFVNECEYFVTMRLVSARDYVTVNFPMELLAQWGSRLLTYLLYADLVLAALWLSCKLFQYYLVYPLAEISFFLLPYLGYIIAVATIFVLSFLLKSGDWGFTAATKSYSKWLVHESILRFVN
ncbi:hypothetical protein B0J12DRAFT_361203 [Macrophomina phaseolina]|uniref:Uncharacterized protein n=1 Tax=Macrophomina phaseolina TaxID=35725 RepID=A0ABQ8FTW8_9PEZI|nr:hypothetical protein B0J12DRAFT_361203 [Macrophomina phaseolina]